MSSARFLFIAFSILCYPVVICGKVTCLDNSGKPVDWFIVYKLPGLPDSRHEVVRRGVGQMYMDVNSQHWQLLSKAITDKGHAVYHTLEQIYSGYHNAEIAYLMYNDQPPVGSKSMNHGHTKGDVCFDKTSGFWLVHSVPHFPPIPSSRYSYPESGTIFGQTFLCVTYQYSKLNDIGNQLLYSYPKFYAHGLPEDFVHDNMNVSLAIEGHHVTVAPWNNLLTLTSSAEQQFLSFAKYTDYGQDMYAAWLAPHFASSMDAETWRNGGTPLPSNCSGKYSVLNVASMKLLGEYWTVQEDHAKWAVTVDKRWICIGDINREESQKYRAGGMVCSQLSSVASEFRSNIVTTSPCHRHVMQIAASAGMTPQQL